MIETANIPSHLSFSAHQPVPELYRQQNGFLHVLSQQLDPSMFG